MMIRPKRQEKSSLLCRLRWMPTSKPLTRRKPNKTKLPNKFPVMIPLVSFRVL